ncbi:hypothetical protein ACFX13_013894 [Malus domestica]
MGQGVKASLDVGQNSSPTICWAKNHQAKHGRRVISLSNLGLKITKQNIAKGLSRHQILDWYPARFGGYLAIKSWTGTQPVSEVCGLLPIWSLLLPQGLVTPMPPLLVSVIG